MKLKKFVTRSVNWLTNNYRAPPSPASPCQLIIILAALTLHPPSGFLPACESTDTWVTLVISLGSLSRDPVYPDSPRFSRNKFQNRTATSYRYLRLSVHPLFPSEFFPPSGGGRGQGPHSRPVNRQFAYFFLFLPSAAERVVSCVTDGRWNNVRADANFHRLEVNGDRR